MAFHVNEASLASFVLYFLKEGSAHDRFIKRLKQRRPVAFLFKQGSMASFVLTFLKEGSAQERDEKGVPFRAGAWKQ